MPPKGWRININGTGTRNTRTNGIIRSFKRIRKPLTNIEKIDKTISYAIHSKEIRERKLLKEYGITIEEYNLLLAKQNGHCALCPATKAINGRLHVDHHHITNKNRGLLCHRCNLLLGQLDKDLDFLNRIIDYIIKGEL
jgi:hypothetical protein